ncbi:MAG: hypothetical protein DMG10_29795 [Acidobacteria bacterium]|nr:MAG: hypothetical protein DMG10_29795 [Acidobacteriota bacterium]
MNVNDALQLTIDLRLGAPQETVQVDEDAPLVETLNNTLGKVTSAAPSLGDERLLGAAVLEKWDGRGQSSIRWLAVERHREFQ